MCINDIGRTECAKTFVLLVLLPKRTEPCGWLLLLLLLIRLGERSKARRLLRLLLLLVLWLLAESAKTTSRRLLRLPKCTECTLLLLRLSKRTKRACGWLARLSEGAAGGGGLSEDPRGRLLLGSRLAECVRRRITKRASGLATLLIVLNTQFLP